VGYSKLVWTCESHKNSFTFVTQITGNSDNKIVEDNDILNKGQTDSDGLLKVDPIDVLL
jgi:hypothetical protein